MIPVYTVGSMKVCKNSALLSGKVKYRNKAPCITISTPFEIYFNKSNRVKSKILLLIIFYRRASKYQQTGIPERQMYTKVLRTRIIMLLVRVNIVQYIKI